MASHVRVGAPSSSLDTVVIARVLGLEALALRVTAALHEHGIEVLLLKGPVTNRWLYGHPLARGFGDIDLLVAPSSEAAAQQILTGFGFVNAHRHVLGIHRPDYETTWTLAGETVDLHTRIAGVPPDRADAAWRRLRQDSLEFALHGRTVDTLDTAARTMLLGLHAARRSFDSKAAQDLDVGLEVLPEQQWRAAADLADDLGAGACFIVGLERREPGRAMLRQIGYTSPPTVESLLLERAAPQEAFVVAGALSVRRRIGARAVLRSWFSTQADERPPTRAVLAALARFPRAMLLVLCLRRRVARAATVVRTER